MNEVDIETAVSAVQQARLLVFRANYAADTALAQAVALLHSRGMSYRQISKVTGLSKSDITRRIGTGSPPVALQGEGIDNSFSAFADEWIWGSPEVARRVTLEMQVNRPRGVRPEPEQPCLHLGGTCDHTDVSASAEVDRQVSDA